MRNSPTEFEIENLIYEKYGKPKNHLVTKVINVYDNRYRINVYHEIYDDELKLYKKRMHSSYFCKYNDGEIDCGLPQVSA
jgi:hypothetical protein